MAKRYLLVVVKLPKLEALDTVLKKIKHVAELGRDISSVKVNSLCGEETLIRLKLTKLANDDSIVAVLIDWYCYDKEPKLLFYNYDYY